MKLAVLLLASSLSGLVTDHLNAPAGSEAEAQALAEIRVWWEKDPTVVVEAVRNRVVFPAAKPGLSITKIRLRSLPKDKDAPDRNEVAIRVPKGYDPAKKHPLFLLVHGTGGFADAEAKQLGPLADKYGFLLVAPQDELKRAGGGWGYTDYEFEMHRAAVLWAKKNYNVDDRRVFVSGGSRGGHAAWALAATWPHVFAGAVPIVGGPRNHFFRYLPNLRHVPVFDMQGAKDQPGLVENVRDAVALLREWKYDVRYEEDAESGHYYPVDWEVVREWAKGRARPGHPKHVTLVTSRNDRARAYWIRLAGLDERKFAKVKPPVNRSSKPLTRAEMQGLVRDNYAKYAARVDATVEGNVIDLAVVKAPRVIVSLAPGLVDLGQKVIITVNGRPRERRVFKPDLETMLRRVKETGDRDLLYPVEVEVRGTSR
ncbi:MAG: alpha/beta hydrolase-fold protein [Planctomycetota bacterium]